MPRSKFAKYTCDICHKTLHRKQTFEAHMNTHLPPEEKQFKCEVCDKSFGSQAWLTRHGKILSGEGQGQVEHVVIGQEQEAAHSSGACHSQIRLEVRGYGTGGPDPFIHFPREIWCMILENVEYYIDLQNMFEVFPGLEALYRRKRQLYLFGRAIPLIAEWIKGRDILRCRQVARQWCMGIDNLLENHPSVRAFNQEVERQTPGGIWAPSSYSKCYHGQCFQTGSPECFPYRKYLEGSYSFNRNSIANFIRKTNDYPAEINPFVGRSIHLHFDFIATHWDAFLQDYIEDVYILLNKWGRHIYFVTVEWCRYQSTTQFVNSLQKMLNYLPNLKGLHVWGAPVEMKSKYVEADTQFPQLPHLETLHIARLSFADPIVSLLLLPQYSMQIRRVHLQLTYADTSSAPTYLPMAQIIMQNSL